MYETLLRPHQVDAAPPLTPIGVVSEKLKQAEARREEKRLRQIANARAGAERRAAKRKAEDDGALEEAEGKRAKTDGEDDEHVPPEVQAQDESEAAAAAEAMETDDATGRSGSAAAARPSSVAGAAASAPVREAAQEAAEAPKICLSKAFPEVRGHTSYLTFAVLLPAAAVEKVEAVSASEQASAAVSAEPTPPPSSAVEASDYSALHFA